MEIFDNVTKLIKMIYRLKLEKVLKLDVTRRTILRNVQEMKKKVHLAYDKKNAVWKY